MVKIIPPLIPTTTFTLTHPWPRSSASLLVTSRHYNATGAGLWLRNVSLSDAGEYKCKGYQISAALVKSKEQLIRLKVQRKLRPQINSMIKTLVTYSLPPS